MIERLITMIYGVALLAFCMLAGSFIGNVLGALIGLNTDVGGVGFAMLLLLIIMNSEKVRKILPQKSVEGLTFWKEMYIPITIAMCASQNVYKAISGGALAIIAGLAAVAVAFLMLPLLNLIVNKVSKNNKKEEK